jgi:ATP-dependent RNA helicase DeaD
VGRSKNADPKWLIPMICRLGHVTKKDIGSIRVFDRETKFEIAKAAEAKFAEAIRATAEDEIKIEASAPPGSGGPKGDARPFRKPFKAPPGAPGPKNGKPPWKKKAGEKRPK